MKTSKKTSKAKVASKPVARAAVKAKKPPVTVKSTKSAKSAKSVKPVKPVKPAKAKPAKTAATPAKAAAKSPRQPVKVAAKAPPAPRVKPVHEWAEAIKKAALQKKRGHHAWPGAGEPPWKGKQRPE